MSSTQFPRYVKALPLVSIALLLQWQLMMPLHAGQTDLANAPLFTSSSSNVKSNIMFIFDNSGSMAWDYLPDDANFDSDRYGLKSYQCNGVAFNPAITYKVPVNADGTSFPQSSFNAAKVDGFSATSSSTTNLSTSSSAYYYKYSGSQKPLAYAYSSSSNLDKTTNFFKECVSKVDDAPGKSVFSKIIVKDQTAAEKQNYANWYSYYRTRVLMMKSSVGLAFDSIDSKYRVGFNVIANETASGTNFLDISDFDSTQKTLFYSKLYAVDPDSWTPLRGALSRAGQYYANKARSQTKDPVQYSCQKNFSILSTDGYWNTNAEKTSSPKFGPYQLDNTTAVGQQDGDAARPMYDGGGQKFQISTSTLQSRSLSDISAPSVQQRTSSNKGKTWTAWVDVNSCSPDDRGDDRVQCQVPFSKSLDSGETWSPWDYDDKCSPDNSGSSRTKCSGSIQMLGDWVNSASCTTSSTNQCQYTDWTGWSNTGTNVCTAVAQSTKSPYTVGTAKECKSYSDTGSTDSLADVAMYYYKTDLRTSGLNNCTGALGNDVCVNDVAGGGRDTATYQHMTTFTLGMGNSGTLQYDPKYLSQSSGDYFDIVQGTQNWPIPNGGAANIDDLWHAAVNGRGQFFSATNPDSLTTSLNAALDAIKAITGAASAAATSTLQPVEGNNDIYVAQFTSAKWTGDLLSYKIDPANGSVSTTPTWSAQVKMDAANPSSRNIYYPKSGALRAFTYANLTADGLNGNFDNFCSKPGAGNTTAPLQCNSDNTVNNTIANSGTNLVDYLRGAQNNSDDYVYRAREHVLGDIINATPLFVGKPAFKYTENGYGSFASGSTRTAVIYAAGNDGMLHAFDRTTGVEKWAYIPTFVMPNMYKLGDTNYANNHVFMVDGSPTMGDIYVSGAWKTILIGGLNSGGRGYYALDVTNPEAPKLLWEFSDTDLGYTFGNPIITKKSDGTWVVVFASGYNNVSPGDGNGHLYVLNANTGAQLLKLDTDIAGAPVGSTSTPSGLAKINAYVESDLENITKVVYGGDLLGNVWRFDIDNNVKPYLSAMRLAQLKVGTAMQPITTKPSLAEVSYSGVKYKVLYVGTGKYLGMSDIANTDTQSIYALKDTWSETGLGDVRLSTSRAMVVQTATAATSTAQGNIIQGTANPVNWTTDSGWYLDFISNGERVSINPSLVLNTLYVGTNVPKTDACTVGGTSWLYKLDIAKGSAIANANEQAIGISLGNVLIMGLTNVQLTTGNLATIVTRSDATLDTVIGAQPSGPGSLRRTSWRILK